MTDSGERLNTYSSQEQSVLVFKSVSKGYTPKRKILSDFSCNLPAGKIIGLLGPNGCGKSTFIKLTAGLLTPDSGEIFICGEPRSEKSNSLISYLPERTYLNSWMSIEELLNFFSDFYEDFDSALAEKMLAELEIEKSAKLKSLSKGTKEKVQLIMVMSRKARLYLLDEPIAGVDPAARDYIMNTIIKNYNPNATVLITTHLIYDIEPILDEFAFMGKNGRIILAGACDEVRAERGKSLNELFREVF